MGAKSSLILLDFIEAGLMKIVTSIHLIGIRTMSIASIYKLREGIEGHYSNFSMEKSFFPCEIDSMCDTTSALANSPAG